MLPKPMLYDNLFKLKTFLTHFRIVGIFKHDENCFIFFEWTKNKVQAAQKSRETVNANSAQLLNIYV